ncbi:hypothetical protein ES319_A09G261700v1 [Gossypium barbadense]|uniref:DNA-directed RNA polymerase RpoA/D/Rpb3-type domain-containing protein n=1 Tax=Gossypium barbadense TaxID=3634 RepID=A0A5J5UK93_GOSBA|nr:hypothetical protein ES319_A09G261700v1 [Gossypium barbadense]
MVREKVKKCVETRIDSKRIYYGRFILSPLMKDQADTVGIVMRRALLGELEGTCITRAKSEKIPHVYSTIVEIVLRGNLYGTRNAFICAKGPGYVTAQYIILPPSVEIVDNTQHVASLTEPIDLCIGLQIERNRGYSIKTPKNCHYKNFHDGSYLINAVFMPVRNTNHKIWTNGSLTPKEALHEASRNLINLFIPFLHAEEENLHLENNQHDKKEIALKYIFIDQSELPPRIYNCLKKSNIHTLLDLLNNNREDLMKIEHFRTEDVKQILGILEKK